MKQQGCDFFDDDGMQGERKKTRDNDRATGIWDDEDGFTKVKPQHRDVREKAQEKASFPEVDDELEPKRIAPKPVKPSKKEPVRFRFYWHEDKNAFCSIQPQKSSQGSASGQMRPDAAHLGDIKTGMTFESPPARVAADDGGPDIFGRGIFQEPQPPAQALPKEQKEEYSHSSELLSQTESPLPDYAVNRITDTDIRIMGQLLDIERDAFGEEGMNKWDIVPFIRYGRVYTMMDGKAVLGAAYFMRDWNMHDKAYLVGIAMRSDMRGRELGTHLLKQALAQLAKEGLGKVELAVDPGNLYAISVYREKLGFYECGQRSAEYGPGEDRQLMNTDL
ncbi:MAG: GNAT family N-acetyltransferase [Bacillota bacterium]|nr:GNAT family N-acetyltransferase [Bacillota bacterium]